MFRVWGFRGFSASVFLNEIWDHLGCRDSGRLGLELTTHYALLALRF